MEVTAHFVFDWKWKSNGKAMYQPDNAVLSKEMFWVLKENQHREVKLRGEKNDKNGDIGHLSCKLVVQKWNQSSKHILVLKKRLIVLFQQLYLITERERERMLQISSCRALLDSLLFCFIYAGIYDYLYALYIKSYWIWNNRSNDKNRWLWP